jgi:hypothetical protein
MRLYVVMALLDAGFEAAWVNDNAKHVSNNYANHVRATYPDKDNQGVAIYFEEDRSALVEVANKMRNNDVLVGGRSNETKCERCLLTHAGECF